MKRIVMVMLAFAVCCGKSKEACKTEVADLMQFLHSFDHEVSMLNVGDDSHLAMRDDLAKAKRMGPVVVIDGKMMSYQGTLVDSHVLAEKLVATHEQIRADIATGRVPRHDPPDPAMLYFQIDGDVSWDRVVTAVAAGAEAGFTRPSFVFALPVRFKPPPRTWVDDKFDEVRRKTGTDGGELATGLAKVTHDIVKSCSAITKVYGQVGADEGGDKAGTLIEGTGPALIECNCDVDMPALRSVMWLIMANPHPTGVLDVELVKDSTALELPATTRWSEASKRFASGAKVWLVAK